MRILFCVNWPINQNCTPQAALTSFAPDFRVQGRPYWFFRHLDDSVQVDVMDYRVPFGTQNLELALTRCLWSQGLAAFLRSRNYDVILSHGGQCALSFALLQTLFRSRPVPHVFFDIARITGNSTRPALISACRQALTSVAATIAHSSHHLKFYEEHFPQVAKNAHFVPLGVDTEEFAPRKTLVQDQIICVGYVKRDWRMLVDAYDGLRTKTKLVLLGIPRDEQILREGVECVPRVSIEEMRQWVSRSRFLVLPIPWYEGCIGQQTLLQAMALGKTALVADIPAVRDYINDGQTGFLYRTGDKQDLQRKMQCLLDSPERVERAGTESREQVMRVFSEKQMARRIMDVLERVVCT